MEKYLNVIPYALAVIALFIVARKIYFDKELRKFFMQSASDENNQASGKSLTAFALTFCIVVGWFIAIHYSDHHVAPEWYFWGIVSLVAGLYGIKEVGKVVGIKNTNPNQPAQSDQPIQQQPKSENKDNGEKKDTSNKPEIEDP